MSRKVLTARAFSPVSSRGGASPWIGSAEARPVARGRSAAADETPVREVFYD